MPKTALERREQAVRTLARRLDDSGVPYAIAGAMAMQAHGYNGAISTEISVMVQRRPNYDALDTVTRSYEVVNRAFVDAGIERQ